MMTLRGLANLIYLDEYRLDVRMQDDTELQNSNTDQLLSDFRLGQVNLVRGLLRVYDGLLLIGVSTR